MKKFKGKAIYNPSGKAGEYSYWACNFYVGCSNGCEYCYCKKGVLACAMGSNVPTLKKCFKDEQHALEIFEKELKANLPELQKHGLFFTFTSDPFLKETEYLTTKAMSICANNNVPVKILTKRADFFKTSYWGIHLLDKTHGFSKHTIIAIGFTLTGHDELETNASTNSERIKAMRKLHDAGFKTWASIEPVIDFESSLQMICATYGFCDLYKVGLMSGKKYDKDEANFFVRNLVYDFTADCEFGNYPINKEQKFYFKDSLLKQAGIDRSELPSNCVNRDYNIFNN